MIESPSLRVVIIGGLLSVLSACAPPQQRPDIDVEIPGSWSRAEARPGTISPTWWHDFADPDLDVLIEEVLINNHDLRAAAARVAMAAAESRISGADLLPQISAGFGGSRQKQNFVGLPIPGDDVLVNRFTQWGVSLDSIWEIDLWGRVRAGKSAAIADSQAAVADYVAARLSLAGQTAKTWFALTEAQLQLELAQDTVASWRRSAEQVRTRFEQGIRPSLDVRLSLSNLAAAEAALEQQKIIRDRLMRQLEILLGRYPEGELGTVSNLPMIEQEIPPGLPSQLLERRPDIVAAERRLAAADQRVWQAKAALFPRISLTASGGTSSDDSEDLTSRTFSVWSVAGNALQPLFESGRLLAGVDLANARARELIENYASTVLEAFREVETALASELLLAQRENYLVTSAEQATRAEELALDRYYTGLEDYITVLESQRRTVTAKSNLINVRRERLEARIDLYLALGGGYEREPDGREKDGKEPPGPHIAGPVLPGIDR